MENKKWQVIGLMSGTSLDGIDIVFVEFSKAEKYSFKILAKQFIPYEDVWYTRLGGAFYLNGEKLSQLNVDYGCFLAELIRAFIKNNDINHVDFIASHGHTVFHQPQLNYTLQIGSGAVIAAKTNCKVICDFRVQDVALGGQGAPLVPIGDKLLFGAYTFCLNLGGFANISYDKNGIRKAFDICPVNIVLNHFTRKIDLDFDDKGLLSRRGIVHKGLLGALNNLPFYKDDKPKSLGFEFVKETVLPIIESYHLETNDVLRTYVEHVAFQISEIVNNEVLHEGKTVLVTGGGAYHDFLIERIGYFSNTKIIIPNKDIIDFKEALIFGFLGVLKDQNEVNCLKSVTGANKDHSSGIVF